MTAPFHPRDERGRWTDERPHSWWMRRARITNGYLVGLLALLVRESLGLHGAVGGLCLLLWIVGFICEVGSW